ncbi:hypothetical protein PV08_04458 [Exophiala spinifera]|uniref:Uncharacterized protein n=1 Tax=Exophiala spinifera TaxID=91928 RepID=A0A0D1ZX45_9EURO|nr:uncharacterized protein PV08_04458 [Exophiala spinifera]KIW17267.1 hypothetical protein PV08_04458 [Exophiala spinifera]
MATHLVSTTLLATALSAVSNILAQWLKAYREEKLSFSISLRPLLQFAIFTLLSSPPNILWQDFLEDRFPGYRIAAASETQILDRSNTARKLLFDQTLGAFVNTIAFVAAMAALKGKGAKAVQKRVERSFALQDTVPLMINSWKLWPLVALFNFIYVPVHRRVIVSSVVGLFWGIYLSLFAALD